MAISRNGYSYRANTIPEASITLEKFEYLITEILLEIIEFRTKPTILIITFY